METFLLFCGGSQLLEDHKSGLKFKLRFRFFKSQFSAPKTTSLLFQISVDNLKNNFHSSGKLFSLQGSCHTEVSNNLVPLKI